MPQAYHALSRLEGYFKRSVYLLLLLFALACALHKISIALLLDERLTEWA